MGERFQILPVGQRAYFPSNEEVIDLLETATSVDIAQAVPYVRIWQIVPGTGRPVNPTSDGVTPAYPLSIKTVEPPRFGETVDVAFRERPPVSLERLSVKTMSTRGAFTNQTIEIAFVVHRPDVVFGESERGRDNWASLLVPGSMHTVEYGWQGSCTHPLLNGDGYLSDKGGRRVVVPCKKRVSFTVVNYDFNLHGTLESKFTIHAVENGDAHLRTANLGNLVLPDDERVQRDRAAGNKSRLANPAAINDPRARELFDELQRRFNSIRPSRSIAGVGPVIRFGDFCDELVAPVVETALRQLGFRNVKLWLGRFNSRCGKTSKAFGDKTLEDEPISDFEVSRDWLQKRLSDVIKNGSTISVTNFVKLFFDAMSSDKTWDRSKPRTDEFGIGNYTFPDVRARTIVNGDSVDFFITDIRAEATKFSASDRLKGDERLSSDAIRKKLRDRNVPYIRFLKANSFIQNADFRVQADEQLKAILIKRYNVPTREQIVSLPTSEQRKRAAGPKELIYSSAIAGDITMIGNFAFDTFAMVWLDFGIPNLSGPFWVLEHEDTVERGRFLTKVSVQSTGEDPLNTQGRVQQQ